MKVTQLCLTLCDPMDSLDQNTRVGNLSLLQGIFPTQGLNPSIPHCKWILYQLSHQGSPRILEWVAYPFSSGSSQPRNRTRVSCIAGGFFTNWALPGKPSKAGNRIQMWTVSSNGSSNAFAIVYFLGEWWLCGCSLYYFPDIFMSEIFCQIFFL